MAGEPDVEFLPIAVEYKRHNIMATPRREGVKVINCRYEIRSLDTQAHLYAHALTGPFASVRDAHDQAVAHAKAYIDGVDG